MRCSSRLLWLAAACLTLPTASAHGAVTRAQLTLDAVAGDVAAASTTNNGLDLASAPDGNAVAAWVQNDFGVPHIYAARYIAGAWTPAQRVDNGLSAPASAPTVGIANGGAATIVFVSGTGLAFVRAASSAAAFGLPSALPAGGANLGHPDLAVAPNDAGYLVATANSGTDIRAYRLASAAFTSIDEILDLGISNMAGATAEERPRVTVDATGATATLAWTERLGSARSLVARKLTGTGPSELGTAVQGDVLTFDGQSLVNTGATGQDQISVASGGGTTWIAHRATYGYPGGDKSRALVRSFDGTTWGPPAAIDAPEATTAGASSPVLAVNDAGKGIATSELGAPLNSGVIARLSAGTWARGALAPSTGNQAAAAITPTGTGLAVFNDLNDPTESIILGRTVGGSQSGLAEELSINAGQRKRSAVAAPLTDGALVAWRQGTGATARIWAAKIDLPGGTEPGGSGGGGGGTTDETATQLTKLRLNKKRVTRSSKKPRTLTGTPKATYLEVELSAAAQITFTLEREQPGRRVGGKCRKQTAGNRSRPKCVLRSAIKTQKLTLSLPSGTSRIQFGGRLGGKSAPPKGTYRLTATIATAATTSQTTTKRLSFTLK